MKHIIDHRNARALYGPNTQEASRIAEYAADIFAAALLMPNQWVQDEWNKGVRDVEVLAGLFDVSAIAIHTRLLDLGIVDPRELYWAA